MRKTEQQKMSWQERKKTIKHKWLKPVVFPEWLCERISYFLGRWAFLDILGHVGRFSIFASLVVGVYVYWSEADERKIQAENQRKAKHFQAWQIINAAQGKPGGGGRKDALEDLLKDGVLLAGVDISKAYLRELNLSGADLFHANLSEAKLWDANLSGARLRGANLSGAVLIDVNLSEAVLIDANLSEAKLWDANLSGAELDHANLSGADLSDANLSLASLCGANLSGARLRGANLSGAVLIGANLSGAELRRANLLSIRMWKYVESIELANIYDVNNPPDGFINWANEHDAVEIEDEDEWKALLDEKRGKKK